MSGSLERVLMFGDVAENFLNVTVSEFMALNAEQRTAIAHSKLWNRYKVFLKMSRNEESNEPYFSLLRIEDADFDDPNVLHF
jgi:hypothetical protein